MCSPLYPRLWTPSTLTPQLAWRSSIKPVSPPACSLMNNWLPGQLKWILHTLRNTETDLRPRSNLTGRITSRTTWQLKATTWKCSHIQTLKKLPRSRDWRFLISFFTLNARIISRVRSHVLWQTIHLSMKSKNIIFMFIFLFLLFFCVQTPFYIFKADLIPREAAVISLASLAV